MGETSAREDRDFIPERSQLRFVSFFNFEAEEENQMVLHEDRLDTLGTSLYQVFAYACHLSFIANLLKLLKQLCLVFIFIDLSSLGFGLLFINLHFAVIVVQLYILLNYVFEAADHALYFLTEF